MTTMTQRKFSHRLRLISTEMIGYFRVATKEIDMNVLDKLDSIYKTVEEKFHAGIEFKDPTAFQEQCTELLAIAQQKSQQKVKPRNWEGFLALAEKLENTAKRLKSREPVAPKQEELAQRLSVVEAQIKETQEKVEQYLSKPRKEREKIA